MINLATLTLKAIDPLHNLNSWYVIQIGKDLFNQWSLQLNYGRIRCQGRHQLLAYGNFLDLLKDLKRILTKRLKSRKRIGVDYELTNYTFKDGPLARTLESVLSTLTGYHNNL